MSDNNRYSRQTAAYGETCGRRIFNSVCVVAWQTKMCSTALVAETLKNLALSGVREIDLIDDGDNEVIDFNRDVSSNSVVHPFLLEKQEQLDKNNQSLLRPDSSSSSSLSVCQALRQGLLDLNSSLVVNIIPVRSSDETNWFNRIATEVTLRFADLRLSSASHNNNSNNLIGCFFLCHPFDRRDSPDMQNLFSKLEQNSIPHTHVQSASIFGRITNNFGAGFVVVDPSAAQPTQAAVSNIGVLNENLKNENQNNQDDDDHSRRTETKSIASPCFIELVAEETEADSMTGSPVDEGHIFKLIFTGSSSSSTDSTTAPSLPLIHHLSHLLEKHSCFVIERVEKFECPITNKKKKRYYFNLESSQREAPDVEDKNMFITFCRSASQLPLRYSQIPSRQVIDKFDVVGDEDETSLLFRTLTKFHQNNTDTLLPRLHNKEDADQMQHTFQQFINDKNDNENSFLPCANFITKLRQFSRTCTLEPNFFATYIGSFAAQEILKFFTQKWIPMTNPVSFDMCGCLPRENRKFGVGDSGIETDFFPSDVPASFSSPDVHYSGLFGESNLERMRSARITLIGAGALSCEYVKIFSLMGLCSVGKGALTITDDDSIAVSNLSRQLLFRTQHVGMNKSLIAAEAAKKMAKLVLKHRGGSMFVRALQLRLDAKSTHPITGVFNHRFWTQQNVLISGVDNIKARTFLSEMSQQHLLPLVDAGTNGPLGHVAAVLPFVTTPLEPNKGGANEDKNIPVCTLHFFPTTVAHCSHHALNTFKNLFGENTTEEDPTSCDEDDASKKRTPTVVDALQRACSAWFPIFVKPVLDLRKAKPPNATEDDGVTPYYSSSSSRRCPQVPIFDPMHDDAHRAFICSFAKLWLKYHNIEFNEEKLNLTLENQLTEIAKKDNWAGVVDQYIREYVPQAAHIPNTTMSPDEKEQDDKQDAAQDRNETEQEKEEEKFPAIAMDFEKDDDDHLSFVWAATVIRARSYSIFAPTKSDVQRIAGRMVPALITTTAAVVAGGVYNTLAMLMHLVPDENPRSSTAATKLLPARARALAAKQQQQQNSNNQSLLEPLIFSQQPSSSSVTTTGKKLLCNAASMLLDYMVNMAHGQMSSLAFEQLMVDTNEMTEDSIDIDELPQWRRISKRVLQPSATVDQQYSIANLIFDLLAEHVKKSNTRNIKKKSSLNEFIQHQIKTPLDIGKYLSVVLKLRIGVEHAVVYQYTLIPGREQDGEMMTMLPAHMLISEFLINSAKQQQEVEKDQQHQFKPPPFVESELFVHHLATDEKGNGSAASTSANNNDENGLTILARLNL